MTDKFKATEKTKRFMPVLGESLEDLAFAQAEEFIEAGQSPHEAASIVANIMIRVAWITAASGALAEGSKPDKEKFKARVADTLDAIKFKDEPS